MRFERPARQRPDRGKPTTSRDDTPPRRRPSPLSGGLLTMVLSFALLFAGLLIAPLRLGLGGLRRRNADRLLRPVVTGLLVVLALDAFSLSSMGARQDSPTTPTAQARVAGLAADPASSSASTDRPAAAALPAPGQDRPITVVAPRTDAAPAATNPEGAKLGVDLRKVLGASKRDPELAAERIQDAVVRDPSNDPANPGRPVFVRWSINTNWSRGMVKNGSRIDVQKILKSIKEQMPDYGTVQLEGMYPVEDPPGVVKEQAVMKLTYKQETIRRLDLNDPQLWRHILAEADVADVRPSWR